MMRICKALNFCSPVLKESLHCQAGNFLVQKGAVREPRDGFSEAESKAAVHSNAMIAEATRSEGIFASESNWSGVVQGLVTNIQVRADGLDPGIAPAALGLDSDGKALAFKLPLPARKPFSETKLKLDAMTKRANRSGTDDIVNKLLREAHGRESCVLLFRATPSAPSQPATDAGASRWPSSFASAS
jgi:hypothetical protein